MRQVIGGAVRVGCVSAVNELQAHSYCYCTIQDETVKEKGKKERSHDVRGGERERETARE